MRILRRIEQHVFPVQQSRMVVAQLTQVVTERARQFGRTPSNAWLQNFLGSRTFVCNNVSDRTYGPWVADQYFSFATIVSMSLRREGIFLGLRLKRNFLSEARERR